MALELITNFVVAALLAVMIGYCFVLNRRLGEWRQNHAEMARLIGLLNQASERAQDSIHQLNTLSQEAEHKLKLEVAKARSLADELSLITEAGGDLADRIEQGFDQQKEQAGPRLDREPDAESDPAGESDWLFRDDRDGPEEAAEIEGRPGQGAAEMLSRLRSTR